MKHVSLILGAALCAASMTVVAEGESLAETGGFVPTSTPALAFKNITLSDLGTTVFPSVKISGGYAGVDMQVPLFCRTATSSSVSYQAQWFDGGYLKSATITFTGGDDGVYAQTTAAKARASGVVAAYTTDFTGDTTAYTTESADGPGYAFHGLKLSTANDLSSIDINFNDTEATKLSPADTATAVGPSSFAVLPYGWSQMLGTNNNTLNGVTAVGSNDGENFYAACASTVTITSTRGTYRWSGYTAAGDVRYGYIDEDNGNNTTPTVTITNIPFDYYKVVFIPSTDTGDTKFGYISVNGVNYSSDNTGKAADRDYEIVENSSDAWGKTQIADYLHGVNYLATPVQGNNDSKTLTVSGHYMGLENSKKVRGCIAAIQIVRVNVPEIADAETSVSAINSACSGEEYVKLAAGTTLAVDTAPAVDKLMVVCDGNVTLAAGSQPTAETLAKFDFSNVKGAVLRSWLTPGVVGFNFNANGARNYAGGYGSEDAANDTALALETGTWCKNAASASGSSAELFSDGMTTLKWRSSTVYCEVENPTAGTFIQGYLDDGGSGPYISLSAVPYETYDVIIYCSTDNSDKGFKAKTVNGTIYTWDSSAGAVATTDNVNATWGLASTAAGKAVYGANTLRINGLAGPLTIFGGTNSNNARGCISAIQIMPAGTSTAPELTLDADADWSDTSNWASGRKATSGPAIVNVSDDVTLTIDESIDLTAVTVAGTGSLTLAAAEGVTVSIDSLSSPVDIGFTTSDLYSSIFTLSAPVRFLYKTGELSSSQNGRTYTLGEGASGAAVSISHNGGTITLTGGTYYLGQSMNSTATTVDFVDATVEYPGILSVGTATYILEGSTSVTASRIILSDGAASRTANMILKDSASLTVTSGFYDDTNQGNMFGHWNGPSTFTIQDNATFTAAGMILVGRTGNRQTINVNGGTFSADGLKVSQSYGAGPNTINMTAGVLELGSTGIDVFGSRVLSFNVNGSGELRAKATTLPVTQPVALATGTTLSITKASGVESATVSFSGTISGAGNISVGDGVTLDLGNNRPEGTVAFDENASLALTMTNKAETAVLNVSSKPKSVRLYAVDGTELTLTEDLIAYDSSAGTITITPPIPVWSHIEDYSFDNGANWSLGVTPGEGRDAAISAAEDAGITVSGTYALGDFAVVGPGDISVSGEGSITADSYDFSGATGRVEYNLPTGSSPVTSGTDTILSAGGSGVPAVAAGKRLTLGPWGATEDDITYTYSGFFAPAAGATLVFSPGEGKVQKAGGFSGGNVSTTVVITNGMLVADSGSGTGFFGANKIQIDNGGVLSLEELDATGYDNTSPALTVNKGGTLQIKKRDTLRRPLVLNGGLITVEGNHDNRGLDFHEADTITVHADSTIQAVKGGTVYDRQGNVTGTTDNPVVYFRGEATTITIDDGVRFIGNITLGSYGTGTFNLVGSVNSGLGNGRMVVNGFDGNDISFNGGTIGTVNGPVMFELNCNQTTGSYTVNAASRFMGSGALTGSGGVTLAAANSKICGSLALNKVSAPNGGMYGDQWNPVSAKVVSSYSAAGIQAITNGSFTISKDCVLLEDVVLSVTTNIVENTDGSATTNIVNNTVSTNSLRNATFAIGENGNLVLEKAVEVGGLTVADGGTVTIGVDRSGSEAAVSTLTVSGTATFGGAVNFVLDFGDGPSGGLTDIVLLESANLPDDISGWTCVDKKQARRWSLSVNDGQLLANSKSPFTIRLR